MGVTRHRKHTRRATAEPQRGSVRGPTQVPAPVLGWGGLLPIAKPMATRQAMWACWALIAAIVFVYAPVWHHDFTNYDDPDYVTNNPHVTAGITWRGVVWALTTGYDANWHPLTWLSHMLDVQLYGLHGGPHHVTNVLFHIANTLLLFGLLRRMTGAMGRSAFVAALFALHPLHVESVAWIAERKDVLSTLFWMLTLWAYVDYVRKPRLGRYLAVLLLFALGLMAKPMLVTLPFVLLLLDFWPLGRFREQEIPIRGRLQTASSEPQAASGPQQAAHHSPLTARQFLLAARHSPLTALVIEKVPLVALSVVSSIVTYEAQRRWGSMNPRNITVLDARLANAALSYVRYLVNMLWPAGLAAFYPYLHPIPGWLALGSVIFLGAVTLAVTHLRWRHPYLVLGWLWYVGTLVPVIGLVQVGLQSMADRYTYVPLIGLFIVLAWGIPELLRQWPFRNTVLATLAAFVIVACMITARDQVQYWRSTLSLWDHTRQVTSGNFSASYWVGIALARQGRVAEAIPYYVESIRINPAYEPARNELGYALWLQGRVDEGIAQFLEALRINPRFAEAHNNMGALLWSQGKADEAAAQFSEALRVRPEYAEAHKNLAAVLLNQGKPDQAIRELQEALQIDPNYQEARRALDTLSHVGTKANPGAL